MAALVPANSSYHAMHESASQRSSEDKPDGGGHWYYSRKEIEENSPSRRDGVDLRKETFFRKSYCTFLQDLGMRLKVPQVTIATAIVFCHRFFLRQSHAKNDRRTIATACLFLAGKVEETPRPLKDVILVSYEIIHKMDPTAVQRIKQKEVYEQQKEVLLLGERAVLVTLAFDLNLNHPYKPLVDVIKKFKVAQNTLAQVAWNFVNDGLRTSLCLQFKPHHIAAGAIFLAAKFLKVKLPSDGDKVWWQEFDVTPRQLEGWFSPSFGWRCQCTKIISLNQQELEKVSNQMLELYEQNRLPPSQASEAKGNADVAGVSHEASKAAPAHLVADDDGGSMQTRQVLENDAYKVEQPKYYDDKVTGSEDVEKEGDQGRNEAIKRIDKDKVKAALEKQRKSRGGDVIQKNDLMDEDDLIERELEEGIELAAESEKINRQHLDNVEERLEAVDEAAHDYSRSEKSGNRKRKKPGSPSEVRKPHSFENQNYRNEHEQDRSRIAKFSHQESDQKRHKQENHA